MGYLKKKIDVHPVIHMKQDEAHLMLEHAVLYLSPSCSSFNLFKTRKKNESRFSPCTVLKCLDTFDLF